VRGVSPAAPGGAAPAGGDASGKSNADQLKARELSLNAIIADSCE
jgi:hypothetical protein